MFFYIGERWVDNDVTVLDLEGPLVAGGSGDVLHDKINTLLASGKRKILVNMQDVKSFDSAGIDRLRRCMMAVSLHEGRLKLVNTHKLKNLLGATKLLTLFENFNNENEAIRSFAKPVPASTKS